MAPSSTTEDLVEEYLAWLTIEKGRSRATVEAYRRDLERFRAWFEERGDTLATLASGALEAHLDDLRSGGRSTASLARALASIRGWLGWLVEEGYLTRDPAAGVRPGRRARSLPKPLPEATVVRLLDSISGEAPVDRRDRALLELLYGTGARVSEAIGVALSDLDFDEELILVTGKGAKQRLVPMGGALRRALARYLEPGGRGELAGAARVPALFLNARGGALTRQGVDLIVRKRALAAGVARASVSAHVFRHSCATHMLAHGADIRVVQELLGHSSIATTQIYTAVSVSSLQREYQNAHPRANG